MKIVYCIPSTFNSGGMERILFLKASYLTEIRGHDVTIITTEQQGKKPFFDFSPKIKFHDLGINYRQHKKNKIIEFLTSPILRFKHKKRLANLFKDLQPDVVISMFQEDAKILPLIKDRSRKIIESHFSRNYRHAINPNGIKRILNDFRTRNDERLIKKYDRFITLTEEDKSDWIHKENIRVIPNPITITRILPEKLKEKNNREIKNILAVGRFNYQKGFDRLIEAWKSVEQLHPDWVLTILGNQENSVYVNKIKELISNYRLKNIILKEPSHYITEEYDNSSFLVMTSHYEGMPLTLLEAMARGLPLISFDCKCGPRDIIENDKNGYLISNGNIFDFSAAILRLIENPVVRKEMSLNALQESRKYQLDPIMHKWEKILESE